MLRVSHSLCQHLAMRGSLRRKRLGWNGHERHAAFRVGLLLSGALLGCVAVDAQVTTPGSAPAATQAPAAVQAPAAAPAPAADQAPAPSQAQPPSGKGPSASAPTQSALPIPPDQVVAHVSQSLTWYRRIMALEQLPADSEEVLNHERLDQTALKALRLAFDFGRAAAALAPENVAGAGKGTTDSASAGSKAASA